MKLDAIRAAAEKLLPPYEQPKPIEYEEGFVVQPPLITGKRLALDPQTVLRLLDVVEAAQKYVAYPMPPKNSPADASLKYLRAKLRELEDV